MKKVISVILPLVLAGCLSLDGVQIGGLESAAGVLSKFQCENGYKGSVKVRENGKISLAFSDGKSSYITYVNNAGTVENPIYVNEKNTLRWQSANGNVFFSYPAADYAQSGQLLSTACRIY